MENQKSEVGIQKTETETIAKSFIEDVQSAADAGVLDEFDLSNPDPRPGEIVDREAYESAIHAGTIGEIPDRNIIYVGKGDPATAYHGAFRVDLPDAETQRRGFYHPQARQIIQQLPSKYKKFIRKGD